MTLLVLVILALVWTVVLSSWWLQGRSEGRPSDSITSFRHQLSVLERRTAETNAVSGIVRPSFADNYTPQQSYPVGPYAPSAFVGVSMTRADARRRRRDVLFTLLAGAGLTLFLALVLGGPVLFVHLFVDALLVGYVSMLVRSQRLAAERQLKVRYLPRQSAEPALLLRRSAN